MRRWNKGSLTAAIRLAKSAFFTADSACSLFCRIFFFSLLPFVFPTKRGLALVGILAFALSVCVLSSFGCRHVPFYRMTSKASASLALSREGITAYERGDLEVAEEKLSEAVKLNESDVETCRYYGETLWKRGKRVEGMDVLREAADKHGPIDSQLTLYRSLGEKALILDRAEQTILWADKIIDLSPRSSVGWELRGKASRALGRPQEALADFQRAVYFETDNRLLLSDIATLQNEIGDYEAALATWQYLELLYPTNREPVEIFAGKGNAYAGLGLFNDAQTAYEIAVRSAPLEPEYRVRLAEIALAQRDFQRVSTIVAEANNIMPNHPELQKLGQAAYSETIKVAEKPSSGTRLR